MADQSEILEEFETEQPRLDRSAFAVISSPQKRMPPTRPTGYPDLHMNDYAVSRSFGV
jgi:hypothetical protein